MIQTYVVKFILGHRQHISRIHFSVGNEIFNDIQSVESVIIDKANETLILHEIFLSK